MAKIYVALIRKGIKTINDVPEQLREEVKKLLEEYSLTLSWKTLSQNKAA